jgi:hypothetical protein
MPSFNKVWEQHKTEACINLNTRLLRNFQKRSSFLEEDKMAT